MVVAITGHRPDKLNNEYINKFDPRRMFDWYGPLSKVIFRELQELYRLHQVTKVIDGMAIGVDQIAAHAAINMDIPVFGAIPCDGQDKMWPLETRHWYNYLLSQTYDHKIISPGPYAAWKMQKRNQWMVDNAATLIAVWDGKKSGGTWNCIEYAQSVNKPIIYLHLKDMEEICKQVAL